MKLIYDIKITTEFQGSQTNIEAYLTDECKREVGDNISFRKLSGTSLNHCLSRMEELCKREMERKGKDFSGIVVNSALDGGKWYSSQESYLMAYRERGGDLPCEIFFEW